MRDLHSIAYEKFTHMKIQIFLILTVAIMFHSFSGYGQNVADSTATYRIETKDGNNFIGNVIAEDSLTLILKTENFGEIKIDQANIKSIRVAKDVKRVGKGFWLPNPQSSHYFLVPNGYGLEKGSAYYQNIWILYNQFIYGITDNFSVGVGTVPLFLFSVGTSSPFWIIPKVSIPLVKNKVNLATGAFLGTVLGGDNASFGLIYGTSTFGSRDKNISLGLAYGFADDEWMNIPVINISGMVRTGPKGYFITENHLITADGETAVMISAGGRSIIRNVGLDYSLWVPVGPGMDSFVAVPFLGITVPIGRKK
jgi:hypothetical protein